jgi:hypothetical protein
MAVRTHKGAHKYLRRKLGKHDQYVVWACVLPDCTHYIAEAFVIGKKSICWRCGDEFVINARTKELYKPHCRDCTRSKAEDVQAPESGSKIPAAIPKQRIDFGDLIPTVPLVPVIDEGD